MRGIMVVLLPVISALYFIDQYEYGGYYTEAFLTQANSAGQQYEQQFKDWWRHR
jgi:hypothetical protein